MKSTAWLDGWFAHKSQDEDGEEVTNPYCERRQSRSASEWGYDPQSLGGPSQEDRA